MGLKKYLRNKADKIGAIASGVGGAGLLGQFPQYLAQYYQRLGGHIDEARLIAEQEAIPRLLERANNLEAGLQKIQDSGTLEKIVSFVRNAEWSVAQRAYEAFTPGMTFDSEGLTYAAVGAGAGFLLYEGAKSTINSLAKKYKSGRSDKK